MTLYMARKGNVNFYIQPDEIEDYAKAGYSIYKEEEVPVINVKEEMEKIQGNQLS